MRAVITAYDGRFWDRSPNADLEFWEGRSDLVGTASRLIQLYLAQVRSSHNAYDVFVFNVAVLVVLSRKCG